MSTVYLPFVPSQLGPLQWRQALNASVRPLYNKGEQTKTLPTMRHIPASFSRSISCTIASICERSRLCKNISVNLSYYGNAGTHGDLAVALHNADLDVFRASLDDLKETLHCQLDGIIASEIVFVVLLEELTHGLGRSTDCVGLTVVFNIPMSEALERLAHTFHSL